MQKKNELIIHRWAYYGNILFRHAYPLFVGLLVYSLDIDISYKNESDWNVLLLNLWLIKFEGAFIPSQVSNGKCWVNLALVKK